jgi:formylglycine-generating enzyme required for sulfatase activity
MAARCPSAALAVLLVTGLGCGGDLTHGAAVDVEDLAGNVWEWTLERRGAERVIRGGGWGNDPEGLRIALEHTNPPDIGLSMVGIRCVQGPPVVG